MANRDRRGYHQTGLSTRAVHAGEGLDSVTGAATTPIYYTAPFGFQTTTEEEAASRGEHYFYSRYANPTVERAEEKIATLERGKAALCFSSGMAAISSTFFALTCQGDEVLASRDLYGGTVRFLEEILPTRGIGVQWFAEDDLPSLDEKIGDATRLIFFETPTNPTLRIFGLRQIASIAQTRKILSIIDNTFATPINQRPLELGIDLVLHSATKYLGGHSDIMGGAVIGEKSSIESIASKREILGGILDPSTAWLLLRSLKTLELRVLRQNENALRLAEALANQPSVSLVHYPGLVSHPGHEVAREQMNGFGGMLSFALDVDEGTLNKLLSGLTLITLATSLGGVTTTVSRPAFTSHPHVPKAEREALGIPDTLLRLSAGIENADDLLDDLSRGFRAAGL